MERFSIGSMLSRAQTELLIIYFGGDCSVAIERNSLFAMMLRINMIISLYLVQSKYAKIHKQEIPSIGRNVLEFFCVPLSTNCVSDFHKKFQVTSTYDTNVDVLKTLFQKFDPNTMLSLPHMGK